MPELPDKPPHSPGKPAPTVVPKTSDKLVSPGIPQATPWYLSLRQPPPHWPGIALGVACLVLFWFVWHIFTRGDTPDQRLVSPSTVPSPYEVFASFSDLRPYLADSIVTSLWRVLVGFFWATIIGVGLGVFAASYRGINAFLTPIVLFGRSIPIGALLPLTFVWFGIDELQKQMFIFIAAVPFVFSDTVKAVSLVPHRYIETAQTLGASRFQIIRKVLFPLALPDIITGLRFLFGLALGYIMLAEAVNAGGSGLGYLMNQGERLSRTDRNYLLLIIIGILAFVIDFLIRGLQRGAFPYRKDL